MQPVYFLCLAANGSQDESDRGTTWVRNRDDLENFLPNLMVLEKGAAIPRFIATVMVLISADLDRSRISK